MKLGPAQVYTDDEVRGLLAVCSRRAPTGIRDAALITLLWQTGLRISEALALRPQDVGLDDARPRVVVLDGKGGKDRQVAVRPEAATAITRWLDVRQRRGLARRKYVFVTLAGEQMSAVHVRVMLQRRGRKADVHRVHPHGFRATFAVNLVRDGTALHHVRDSMGHSNLAITDAYLRRVNPEDALDAVLAAGSPSPRQQLLAAIDDATAQRLLEVLG